MKKYTPLILALSIISTVQAQVVKESITPISKASRKGFLDKTEVLSDGQVKLTYQIKGAGKNEILYEEYAFNPDLKLVENKPVTVQKEMKEDITKERMTAYVGACSSFDITSMKIRVARDKILMEWNYKKQRYEYKKTLESETIKVKSEKGKFYYGIDAFRDSNGDIVAFAYQENKDKANPRTYVVVRFSQDGGVEEKQLDVTGNYSIVYTQLVYNDDDDGSDESGFVAVLAPNKGDLSQYLFLHYDRVGNQKSKVTFKSPANAMLVTSILQQDDGFYLFGTSVKSKGGYGDEFDDYQPLSNPCFDGYNNMSMVSYTKKADVDMDNFHFIKIKDGAMKFATSAPFSSIKAKMKTPPSQKGGTAYKGGKFRPAGMWMTPAGEYLMSGQLTGWGFVRGVSSTMTTYGDIVCLHFDRYGEFKAQYAVDRIDDDKKSKVFFLDQNFYISADGKTGYWLIYEVKGVKGFGSFMDAYNNIPTFYARKYPRVAKINFEAATLSDFTIIGQQKYFVNQTYTLGDGSLMFVGKDEDEENIWMSQLSLK